jgi:release factor glutamine methyltransferase
MAITNSKRLNLFNQSRFKTFNLEKYSFGKYDLIVSNPPYILSKNIKNLSKDIINYEPLVALNGGLDGLDLIKKVIYKANVLLKANGVLAIEIGHHQYSKVSSILRRCKFAECVCVCVYKRNVRCIISTKVGNS